MRLKEPPQTTAAQSTHGAAPKPDKLIRLPAVEDRTGLRKSTVYAGVRAGTFPAPVRLSARAVAWRESDIDRWISDRMTTRGAA